MKNTGIIRNVDALGRVVLPIELRRTLDIQVKDAVEVFVDGERLIMQKYKPNKACVVTGEVSDENQKLPGGIWLSYKGMEIIADELERNKD
ncbi:AbrB/MazE/SpoVT family DNA-binding domain-containing protein [Halobacillus massiliensis]|uniref:AbrB/MazE/SpoVT family DNA-binding domain-containing protein n=1 Tax=Halobacillus massiliensis TaxID=1926286 RepID=UPI0009E45DCC|nr:AbrB/MazE/SpoVT family DNA-binding domain-containing protein [Halobacillus massiliensis]